MRTYGLKEDYYREASNKDIRFIRFEPQAKPEVEAVVEEGRPVLRVTAPDPILGQALAVDADYLFVAAAVIPAAATEEVAGLFKVTLSPDGFFKEAHVKLKPVEFAAEGVYLCGMAHYPKHMPETINQAYGAASRVLTLLSQDTVTASGSVCEVAENDCVACGTCITACTYGAIDFRETHGRKACGQPRALQGRRGVQREVPDRGDVLKHFTDDELLCQIDAAFPRRDAPTKQMGATAETFETTRATGREYTTQGSENA